MKMYWKFKSTGPARLQINTFRENVRVVKLQKRKG